VRVAQLSERGGDLVGALTVDGEDEVMVVMEKGKIVRSRVDEVRRTGRNTMGVQFATPDKRDSIVAVARNADRGIEVVLDSVLGDAESVQEGGEPGTGETMDTDVPTVPASVGDAARAPGSVTFEPDSNDGTADEDDNAGNDAGGSE
jgi:DNA gyrase subunit A